MLVCWCAKALVSDTSLSPCGEHRNDGYGQQYPSMPYGMHPSGMYPQQQVRQSLAVFNNTEIWNSQLSALANVQVYLNGLLYLLQ